MHKNRDKQMKAGDEQLNKAVEDSLNRIKNKLMVMSGKGGVGKSTIAVNIAVALSEKGYKVGLMDIDFHGPNTLKMLNLEKEKILTDGKHILPLKYSENLQVISMAALLEDPDTAIIWRGPLKIGVIKQFIADVKWDNLDWLIIDSPPGTGDEPLTVAQIIKNAKAIIVTTPQEISLMDVRKSINFCKNVNMPIIGIIENMSGFICPECGAHIEIFKSGGGKKTANEMNVEFLGSIPFEKNIMECADSGTPYFIQFKGAKTSNVFEKIIDKILSKK